jgi:glyceraldehyde 3-phosphate dehydrogenase
MKGKLNGFSLRVPTPAVSIVDVAFELRRPYEGRSQRGLEEGCEGELKGILGYTEEPLVSIDFKETKDPPSSTRCPPWSSKATWSRSYPV